MHRHLPWPILGLTALTLAGCGAAPSPLDPMSQSQPAPHHPAMSTGGNLQSLAGHYRIHVDLKSLSAIASPVVQRDAVAIGDLYELSINQFFGGSALQIGGISTGASDLTITYSIAHPFNAPSNLAGPATAANRADLGVSGRVLFMLPAPANRVDDESSTLNKDDFEFTFGTETVVANTKFFASIDAIDGYYDPAGLIDLADFPAMNGATIWPFRELVDEGQDPRTATVTGTAVSNGAVSTGNYNAATGGWQNGNIGAGNTGWTGYGVLHQGQTASNSLQISLASLEGSTFELDVAVIAMYTDPRGGANATEKRANRLPSSDETKFAYRMPWGTTDVSSTFIASPAVAIPMGSTSFINAAIVDYDFGATEDPAFPASPIDTIPTGTTNLTSVTLSSGDLGIVDQALVFDVGDGTAESPANFAITTANNTGTDGGVDLSAYAMLKIVDPNDTFVPPAGMTVTPLNENSPPAPLSANQPESVVYAHTIFTIS